MTPAPERFRRLAELPFAENRPTDETARDLADELLFQRATQTYLWALPLLNTMGMKEGSERVFGAGYHVLPIFKERLDAKTLITTPNSDVIYALGYVDLGADGPLVFEAPPRLQGILLDFWQQPIPVDGGEFFGDVGFFGPDAGKGGKFLLLPPNHAGDVPDGYHVYRSATNNVFVFLRSFYDDPADLSPAVELVEQSRIYPLGQQDSATPMTFPDGSGTPADMLPNRTGEAFDQLKRLLDSEGPHLAQSDQLGVLASLGIVADQPFAPDERTRSILDAAAATAYKMSRVIAVRDNVTGRDLRVYPDRRWINPIADGTPDNPGGALDLSWRRVDGGYLDIDLRTWFFTNYYSISPGMISQTPGKGAKYMIAFTDADGAPLVGDDDYTLHLPPDIPAANFWSVTLYEAENASGLANGQPFPSFGLHDRPQVNPDGSVDMHIGPSGGANWLKTVPGRGFFAILRLYGPTEAAIDKTWKPGDIEKI